MLRPMELHTTFSRRVGAGTDPVLGTDAIPTGLPAIGVGADLLRNIVRCIHPFVSDNPVQRIALFYRYVGAGAAPVIPMLAYCYVRETNSWFQVGPVVNLSNGVVAFIDSIAGILPMQAMPTQANMLAGGSPGDSCSSLEVVLIPSAPAGAPAGTYTFGAIFDSSLAGGDADNDFALILAELVEVAVNTQKILTGQHAVAGPYGVADNDAVKTAIATVVAPVVYTGGDLNGVAMTAGGVLSAPHNVSVTTAVSAAAYNIGAGNPIVITGTDYYTRLPIAETLLLTNVNGGETITGTLLFDAATISIAVAAQANLLGTFEFGVGDLAPGIQRVEVTDGAGAVISPATETTLRTIASAFGPAGPTGPTGACMQGGSDGGAGMTVPSVSPLHSVTKNRDGWDVSPVAPPASAWATLRTFAGTTVDTVNWTVMETVTGIVDLSGLVYPTALTGLALTVNGQTKTFAAGQPTDMADALAELNAAITDITFTAPGPGFALVLVKKTPGNLAISGTAAAVLGLTVATTGSWVALPTYNTARPNAPGVEVSFPQVFSVGNAPTEVIFRLWRLNPQYGGTAEIAREIRVSAADIAALPSHRIPFDGSHAFLSVAFVGGTAPTITGVAKIRVVYDGVLSNSDATTAPSTTALIAATGGGSLYVESAALENMHLLKAGAGQHNSTHCYNSGVPLCYLVIVDQLAAPTSTVTACRPICEVPGGGAVLSVSKRTFALGGWLCLSTNRTTYTDPGAVGWFVVQGD